MVMLHTVVRAHSEATLGHSLARTHGVRHQATTGISVAQQ